MSEIEDVVERLIHIVLYTFYGCLGFGCIKPFPIAYPWVYISFNLP